MINRFFFFKNITIPILKIQLSSNPLKRLLLHIPGLLLVYSFSRTVAYCDDSIVEATTKAPGLLVLTGLALGYVFYEIWHATPSVILDESHAILQESISNQLPSLPAETQAISEDSSSSSLTPPISGPSTPISNPSTPRLSSPSTPEYAGSDVDETTGPIFQPTNTGVINLGGNDFDAGDLLKRFKKAHDIYRETHRDGMDIDRFAREFVKQELGKLSFIWDPGTVETFPAGRLTDYITSLEIDSSQSMDVDRRHMILNAAIKVQMLRLWTAEQPVTNEQLDDFFEQAIENQLAIILEANAQREFARRQDEYIQAQMTLIASGGLTPAEQLQHLKQAADRLDSLIELERQKEADERWDAASDKWAEYALKDSPLNQPGFVKRYIESRGLIHQPLPPLSEEPEIQDFLQEIRTQKILEEMRAELAADSQRENNS